MSPKKRKADGSSSFQGTSAKKLQISSPNPIVKEEVILSEMKEVQIKTNLKLKRKLSSEPSISSLRSDNKCSVLEELDQACKEVLEASQNKEDIQLPETISVLKFAECRASEIATIMQEVTRKRPKLSHQQLPHHMRRRAASHNPNRIPRRLREKALKEIQKAKKSKRPSRRHRRRPKNLLAEYNRRQRKYVWLETHIWFAKRFKMQELWGYKIPLHPNDKNVRAAFRATARGVLIQDLSYFCCIELAGTQEVLLSTLCLLTNTEVGMTFAAKISLNGSREGHTFLYQPQSYPFGAIGPVSFLWKPIIDDGTNKEIDKSGESAIRQLWIWCHPSMHNNLVEILVNLFHLKKNLEHDNNKTVSSLTHPFISPEAKVPENVASNDSKNEEKKSDQAETILKNALIEPDSKCTGRKSLKFTSNITCMKTYLRFQRTPTYESENVKMTLLKDNLVRHRLIGPMALSVVSDALKVIDVSDNGDVSDKKKKWWEVYYSEAERKSLHDEKRDIWDALRTCSTSVSFPPKTVIGLTVKDPRLSLPTVKSELENIDDVEMELDDTSLFTSSIASSALWDQEIRDEVTSTKQAESTINQIREQFLVTEKTLDLGRDESRIPVIAIQQTGINGYSSGWDIIAPLGWSMPFWIAFIYRKAHAAGLREFQSLHKELQQPLTPYHYPDSQSGREFGKTDWQQKMTKHYRYPPNKRPSFQKLGVLSPYCMPWGTLVADWGKILNNEQSHSKESQAAEEVPISTTGGVSVSNGSAKASDFFVLRNKKQIRILKEVCNVRKCQKLYHVGAKSCLKSFNEFEVSIDKSLPSLKQSIILVQFKNLHKGIPSRYSGVYSLQESDVEVIKRNSSDFQLSEPIHPVIKVKKVKKKLHTLKKVEPIKTKNSKKTKCTKDTSKEIQLVMPTIDTIYSNCSRKLIGYVDDGAFSFRNGYGCGIGHCTLMGFLEVINMCQRFKIKPLVLTRAQNSLQYKVCEIDVGNCF